MVFLWDNRQIKFRLRDDISLAVPSAVTSWSDWVNLKFVLDADSSPKTLKIFVDDVEKGSLNVNESNWNKYVANKDTFTSMWMRLGAHWKPSHTIYQNLNAQIKDLYISGINEPEAHTVTLSGADATSFEVVGTELFLKAGGTLDYETKNSYAVTLTTGSVSVTHTLSITDVNEAPVAVAPSGAGTEADPYLIANMNNLYWLSQTSSVWSKHFLQTADINASGTSLLDSGAGIATIGGSTIFSGTYDGGGRLIDGLTINRLSTDAVGMFGQTSNAVIKNLGLKNVNVKGKKSVGGLVGRAYSSTITGCYVTGSVTSTGWMVGGIVGQSYGSTVSNCYNTANVKSTRFGFRMPGCRRAWWVLRMQVVGITR